MRGIDLDVQILIAGQGRFVIVVYDGARPIFGGPLADLLAGDLSRVLEDGRGAAVAGSNADDDMNGNRWVYRKHS